MLCTSYIHGPLPPGRKYWMAPDSAHFCRVLRLTPRICSATLGLTYCGALMEFLPGCQFIKLLYGC